MIPGDFQIDAEKTSSGRRRRQKFNREDFLEGDADDHLLPNAEDDEDEDIGEETVAIEEDGEDANGKRKRRRRGRRGGRRRRKEMDAMDPGAPPSDGGALLDGLAVSVSNLLGDEPDELPPAAEGGLEAKPVAMPEAQTPDRPTETKSSDEDGADEPKEGKKRRRRRRRSRRRRFPCWRFPVRRCWCHPTRLPRWQPQQLVRRAGVVP